MKLDVLKIIIAALALLAASARGQTTQPTDLPGSVIVNPQDRVSPARIISLNSFIAPGGDAVHRGLPRELLSLGWVTYAEKYLSPQFDRGLVRIALWNPLGKTPGAGDYEFDQYDRALSLGPRDRSHWGFISAIRPLTRRGEVIVYIGAPKSAGMSAQQFADYFERNIAPFVAAGCSIGFDATTAFDDDSAEFRAICSLRSRGVKVYCEGYPHADQPQLAEKDTFLMPANLAQAELQMISPQPQWQPIPQIRAEQIVVLQQPVDGNWGINWQRRDAQAYLDRGMSVCVQMSGMGMELFE